VCLVGATLAFTSGGRAQTAPGSHAHDFLIFTTVFTDQGFALPGARVRVRREGERKFRWEGASDHQGELAFRVPPGTEYEIMIEARGFKTQTRKIDAKSDNRVDLTIRMEVPAEKGEKP
jgi:Carboxypeptidase regulatory-like domain